MRAVSSIVRRLFASNTAVFVVTVVVVLCATTSDDSAIALSNGNYAWLLAVMTPFVFVFHDFSKLMHLGASKQDYYLGALTGYGLMSLLISMVNTGIHSLLDPLNRTQTVINLMDVCGWTQNGVVVAFLQQSLFLFLIMVSLHVLLSMQTRWYGWVTDAVIISIVCVCTPIAPLRAMLAKFFGLIMLNANAPLHIAVCLALSALTILAGLAVLKRTAI